MGADTSRDRNRADVARKAVSNTPASSDTEHKCGCQEKRPEPAAAPSPIRLSLEAPSAGSRPAPRRRAQHNPSRALVLARREALSKRGKSATTSQSSGTAAVARQGNPDMTTRELALKARELRSKTGSASKVGSNGSGSRTRPSGPNRHGAKQSAAAADAHWKVGASETLSGQTVTGTQANRSVKTTGNEASTCRSITGTEYLGAEVFQAFCQGQPAAQQPAKVRVSSTSHGNAVTGSEVGRSEKVTGDEPGTCKTITGTEYIGADQSAAYCGGGQVSPRKVGHSLTEQGRPVSGVMVGRSASVTGDEAQRGTKKKKK